MYLYLYMYVLYIYSKCMHLLHIRYTGFITGLTFTRCSNGMAFK